MCGILRSCHVKYFEIILCGAICLTCLQLFLYASVDNYTLILYPWYSISEELRIILNGTEGVISDEDWTHADATVACKDLDPVKVYGIPIYSKETRASHT